MQSLPGYTGTQAREQRVFLWEAGWTYTEQEVLDWDLTGNRASGAEGNTLAKAERLAGILAHWEMLAGASRGRGEWRVGW